MMKFNKKGETDNIYRLKIVMVGPEGAGFDGFLGHLHKSKQDFSSTLGVNIYTDRIFQEGRRFQINIWHLTEPTDEKAKNARSLFIMGANAVIVLYDGSKKNGLRDAESYVKEIKESFPPSIPRILVGNLVSGREVKFQDADKFAHENDFLFAERYTYDLDVLLMGCAYLSLKDPLPEIYRSIFAGSMDWGAHTMSSKGESKDTDKKKDKGSGLHKYDEKGERTRWKKVWESLWNDIMKEEQMIIDQRLTRLESDLNNIISDFYTLRRIISPLLEFFEIPDINETKFPMLIKKWIEESPEKIEALRHFLQNDDDIQEKYWQDFYQLRSQMVEEKIEVIEKFMERLEAVLEENRMLQQKVDDKLSDDDIPRRIKVDMAEIVHYVENLLRELTEER